MLMANRGFTRKIKKKTNENMSYLVASFRYFYINENSESYLISRSFNCVNAFCLSFFVQRKRKALYEIFPNNQTDFELMIEIIQCFWS